MSIGTPFGLMVGMVACWGSAGMTLCVGNAAAVTIKNNDQQSYQLEVIADGNRIKHDLPAGKALADVCKTGCVVRLNGSANDDYALEGSERVSIEGGLVYYDGEEVAPKADAAGAQAE